MYKFRRMMQAKLLGQLQRKVKKRKEKREMNVTIDVGKTCGRWAYVFICLQIYSFRFIYSLLYFNIFGFCSHFWSISNCIEYNGHFIDCHILFLPLLKTKRKRKWLPIGHLTEQNKKKELYYINSSATIHCVILLIFSPPRKNNNEKEFA